MLAAKQGHIMIVKMLLDRGANVNVKAGAEYTALRFAVEDGHQEVVKALIGAGAR